jgi:hypothetical protein
MPVFSHHLLRTLADQALPLIAKDVQDSLATYNAGVDPSGALTKEDEDAYDAAKAAYDHKDADENLKKKGYSVDTELSDKYHKVYVHPEKETLIGYRGTKSSDLQDLYDDVNLALGNRSTKGFKNAKEVAKKAKEKHKKEIVHAGHSLGGTKALEAQKSVGGKTVAFNPGQSIFGEYTNQRVYLNKNDVVANRIRGSNIRATKKQKGLFNAHKLSQFQKK